MYRIIKYGFEGNIGNTVQTMGLSHLLSPAEGIYYDQIGDKPLRADEIFVVNGWFCHREIIRPLDAIFCGVHVTGSIDEIHPSILEWLRNSGKVIGARDPMTADFLNSMGMESVFVGCASMMFERYDGERSGVISVDYDGPGEKLTHFVEPHRMWEYKWDHTSWLIEKYRKAEAVYTSRLHVALPCLAMGTPVFLEKNNDKRRFSILDAIGIEYEKLQVIDISWLKQKYIKFLSNELGEELTIKKPMMPW